MQIIGGVLWVKLFFFRYHTEFGFTLPGRPIIVDDIRIRGVGKAFSETEKLIEQASGPPRVETVSNTG